MRKTALVVFGLVVAIIVALGLVVLSSASGPNGLRLHHDSYHFMKRQFLYLAAGLGVAVVVALVDYRIWRDHAVLSWLFFGVVFLLLLAVFPPLGRPINGSYRWIPVGPVNLQPSELAKLALVIVLAVWLDKASWRVELFWRGAVGPMALVAFFAAPVFFEPDFGSTAVLGMTGVLLMFVAGVRLLHILPFLVAGAAVVAVKVGMNANRMARIAAWTGGSLPFLGGVDVSDAAAKNAEHQGDMALAAIGRGGLGGVGLNESMQKYQYLPEAHTDMVFAIGAEELGLAFSVGVFLLFVVFFVLCVYFAYTAADRFGRLLVIGMSFVIFFAAMFNMGVVCEALPMKGMALPFFSYGGTNLVSAFFAVGTIFSVALHADRVSRKRQVSHG